MTPELKTLNEQRLLAQEKLFDFLKAQLEVCFTTLTTARALSSPDYSRSALESVSEGLLTVRTLSGKIEDARLLKRVQIRTDELEKALELYPERL
jgi:hypothetical protein